ncbi:MAG: nuclear transport factor 2 family protein [Chitinophagaceae bacterium]
MNDNQQIITRFYTAFSQLDFKKMQECYHENAIFFDPVFEDLNAAELKDMWEMLCKNARDFSLQFMEVEADDEYGTCKWVATYTFSQTGNKVTNKIKAYFKFHEGKIAEHTDNFDLWKWSRQALGLPGWLLGWNEVLHKKIRAKAQDNLAKFMKAKASKIAQ